MASEYTLRHTVRISDCDATGRWRPSALMVQLQEMAELHAVSFGLSRANLIAKGMAWVLYRQHIVLQQSLTFGDEVNITTWPAPVEGPLFPRYFVMVRDDGTQVGQVVTSWVLMDIHTRRPLRPSVLEGKIEENKELTPPLPLPGMLRIENTTPWTERTVRYTDLDVNGHMSNTRYIDWICDAMPLSMLHEKGLVEWQINYLAEAKPFETLKLLRTENGTTTFVHGIRASDDRPVFDACVTLSAN